MAVFSNLILTNAAKDMLAQSLSRGAEIRFTRFVISQHAYSAEEIPSMTAVQDITGQAEVSDVTCEEDYVTVSGLVKSSETTGYYLQTAALYASVDGTEFVCAAAIAQTADYIPAPVNGRYTSIALSFVIGVSDTSVIDLTVSQTAAVTQEQLAKATTDIQLLQQSSHTHANKSVLDGVKAVDAALSTTSTNPVQNKAVTDALNTKSNTSHTHKSLAGATLTSENLNDIAMTACDVYQALQGHTCTNAPVASYPFTLITTRISSSAKSQIAVYPHNNTTYRRSLAAGVWSEWVPVNVADRISTPRTINGVPFDGSANITIPRSSLSVHSAGGTSGSTGYVKIATFKIAKVYQNSVVTIEYARRTVGITRLHIRWNNANSTDPTLASFLYESPSNYNNSAYLYKSATSTWDLYIAKAEEYDNICITDCKKPSQLSGTTVAWTDVQASSLPSGYVSATKFDTCHVHSNKSLLDGYTDSGWITCALGSFATSGTIKYRIVGKQIAVYGSQVVLAKEAATSPKVPQSIASCTYDFTNIKNVSGIGRWGSYAGIISLAKYNGSNIIHICGIGSAIPTETSGGFYVTGFID